MRRAMWASLGIVLAMATAANAQSRAWNVDANGDWATTTNWSPVGAPVANDNLVLGNVITAIRTLTLTANYTLSSLTVNNTNVGSFYNLTPTAVRTITFTGAGTKISVGALGANLAPSANPTYVTLALPNTAGLIFDIGGPTYIGTVNQTGTTATLTKIGAGRLTWGGSGDYRGTLTVNAGDLRMTGRPTNLGNFLMTPTGADNLTYDGTAAGWMGMASTRTARFLGTADGNVIVSPGTTAGATGLLRFGTSGNTNIVTLDNLTRYNADLSGATNTVTDFLGVIGTLNLGAAGTTNSLYINLPSGSLQTAYLLANATAALTGKFNEVYYNNVLVGSPETAGAIAGTHRLVYGATSVRLEDPVTNDRDYWLSQDTAITTASVPLSSYSLAGNWSRGATPTAADSAWVMNGGSWGVPLNLGAQNITYGEFVIANGSNWRIESHDSAYLTLNVVSDCGTTGDFWYRSTTIPSAGYRWGWRFNVYGNYYVAFTGAWGGYSGPGHLTRNEMNLYGTNKGFRDSSNEWATRADQNIYGSYFDNGSSFPSNPSNTITVKPGGRIIKRPGVAASEWVARRFIFEGGQANLPAYKDNVTFTYEPNRLDNGPAGSNRLVITGGVTYPQDLRVGTGYWEPKVLQDATYTWRFKNTDCNPSPTTVIGRDLLITDTAGTAPNDGMFVNFEENGTLGKARVTVLRDMYLHPRQTTNPTAPGSTPPTFAERYGFRGRNADLRIGRDLTIGLATGPSYAWWPASGNLVDLGNATIYLGRNLAVHRLDPVGKAFWSGGTSTIICDGNGTAQTQQIRTYGIRDNVKLNNFIVRNPGGVVVLENAIFFEPKGLDPYTSYPRGDGIVRQGGDLLLTGNLSIECGTFRTGDTGQPGRQIAFNGDCHTIYVDPSAIVQGTVGTVRTDGVFDNIILRPDAQLTLLSNISIAFGDNLVMLSNSKLFLNGFTLMAEGNTWISDQVSSDGVPWDGQGGMIYGTFAIPEPATWLLLGTGALGVLGYLRRRRMT